MLWQGEAALCHGSHTEQHPPVATTRGTPASAAAATAARTPGVNCCLLFTSVPSTSLMISSSLRLPLKISSVTGLAPAAAWARQRHRAAVARPCTRRQSNGGSRLRALQERGGRRPRIGRPPQDQASSPGGAPVYKLAAKCAPVPLHVTCWGCRRPLQLGECQVQGKQLAGSGWSRGGSHPLGISARSPPRHVRCTAARSLRHPEAHLLVHAFLCFRSCWRASPSKCNCSTPANPHPWPTLPRKQWRDCSYTRRLRRAPR